MREMRQAGQWAQATRAVLALAALTVCLAPLGCSSAQKPQAQGDPLVGEIYPKGQAPSPSGPAPANTSPFPTSSQSSMPPSPVPESPTSPAALANATLPGGRPLAIKQIPFDNAPATLTKNTNPKIQQPQPVVQPIPKDTATSNIQPTSTWAGPQDPTELYLAQLRSRGVLFQKQEMVPGGIKLYVIVPHPTQAGVTRNFEAIATTYPAAVQAILQQIDQQK